MNPASSSAVFSFPPHYAFPPFFTLQPTSSTRLSQLASWSALIQSYCRHHRTFVLSLSSALDTSLFHNGTLHRRLNERDARAVLDWMCTEEGGGRAEWVSPATKSGKPDSAADKIYIFWRRPEEWAGVVEAWVEGTGQKNTVLTLYELLESDATSSEEFHGMDSELLQRSLQLLVKRGKAQVFGAEGEMGVKFF